MKIFLIFFLAIISCLRLCSQGVELYGGYPVSIKARSETQNVSNWNNGQGGVNFMVYIRPVALQFGLGYMSDNYTVYSTGYREVVSHYSIYVPIMVYPRLYTDGKNTLSIGVGCKVKIPSHVKAYRVYDNGSTDSKYNDVYATATALPRISLRYSRSFGKRFLFFADAFSEFTVMSDFYDGGSGLGPIIGPGVPTYTPPHKVPSYYSLVTLGANVGFGYLLPFDPHGTPRYFQKRQKKTP